MTATTTEPAQPVDADRLLEAAIRTLTAAARLDSGPDFAGFITLAVAGAAANVGGVERALVRRSGSWEAARVRDMLQSTVGDDRTVLMEHRTEPLVINVHVDEILNDLDYWKLYDEAEAELQRREDAIGIPRIHCRYDLDPATSDVQTGVDERGVPTVSGHPGHRDYAAAVAALPATTDEQEAAREAIEEARDDLYQLQNADKQTFGEAFKTQVEAAAAELFPNLPVPVEVRVHLDWANWDGIEYDDPSGDIWMLARSRTPIPSSGISVSDYPLTASVGDIERNAGRTPLARLDQAEPPQ